MLRIVTQLDDTTADDARCSRFGVASGLPEALVALDAKRDGHNLFYTPNERFAVCG